jgi:hypothetical protein
MDQDLLIIEALRSHSDKPHSVRDLRASGQPLRRDLYLTRHDTHQRQTSTIPAKKAASNQRLKERGRWDRRKLKSVYTFS